ncbi:MAG: hypothetical protein WCL00_12000 [Bacteroidota bacterium]
MKKKIIIGLVFGVIAGMVDLIPMIAQSLPWDANLSALTLWIVSGFFIQTTTLDLKPILKGIVISLICLLPSAFIIAWEEPAAILPILAMTVFLGALLGFSIERLNNKFGIKQ